MLLGADGNACQSMHSWHWVYSIMFSGSGWSSISCGMIITFWLHAWQVVGWFGCFWFMFFFLQVFAWLYVSGAAYKRFYFERFSASQPIITSFLKYG